LAARPERGRKAYSTYVDDRARTYGQGFRRDARRSRRRS